MRAQRGTGKADSRLEETGMRDERRTRSRALGRRLAYSATTLALALTVGILAGCQDLLDVELPGEIEESALADPSNAQALVTSVVGAFECTFTNYALLSGNVGDELMVAGSFAVFFPYDQRDLEDDAGGYPTSSCASEGGLYTPINQARWMGDETIRRLEGFADDEVADRESLLATTYAYTGHIYQLFGQSWCAMAVDEGPLMQPSEVLPVAEELFSTAIDLAAGTGQVDIENLARVGRARARLLQENYAGAISDAELVPEGFAKLATRSDVNATRRNKIYELNHLDRRTIPEPEYWNLEWKGVEDPRVRTEDTGEKGNDSLTPFWLQFKYTSRTDPLPIVRYAEAQLIIAEASARTGDEDRAVAIINELHDAAGLPEYAPGSDGPVMDHLIQERARELFLEGHRHYDLLRFDLPFPEGSHDWNGRTYRGTTCFPIPSVERDNNPNITGS